MTRHIAAALAALAVWCAASPAAALPDETWVLSIGNNFGDPGEVGLRYAERDAQQVADVFRQLGGVPSTRIQVLADASASAVLTALDAVEARVARRARAGRNTGFVVFYSGHADAENLHLSGTHLAFDAVRARLEASRAGFRLLIVDACGSGGVSRVKGVAQAASFAVELPDVAEAEGFAIITSSTANESSQESDRLQASFFSHHLVNGLRGAADANGDHVVSLDETYTYTYAETLRSSGRTMALQHPTYRVDLKGKGDVVLTRMGRGDARGGRLRLGGPVVHLISDGSGSRLVAEVRPGRSGAEVALPAGRYRVQERLPRVYREYAVRLKAGQSVALVDLPSDEVRYDRLLRKGGGQPTVVHGLAAMGGARGEIVPGEGPTGQLVLGYGLDTRFVTMGLRLRGAVSRDRALESGAERLHQELGIGLTAEHVVDLSWASLSFGVLLEGAVHQQRFAQNEPDRLGGAFGVVALLAAERRLWSGLSLRLEAGPSTTLLRRARTDAGAVVETEHGAVLTGWMAGGIKWRL